MFPDITCRESNWADSQPFEALSIIHMPLLLCLMQNRAVILHPSQIEIVQRASGGFNTPMSKQFLKIAHINSIFQ
jgi:hypothetical protein